MKYIFKISIFFALIYMIIGCQNHKSIENRFSSLNDTIILKTKKVKGNGLFQFGVSSIEFQDTSKRFTNSVKYPKNINDLKRFQLKTDFGETKNYNVEILKGIKNGKQIFIVDENNNKDFTDDSIREYKPINWSKSANLIRCKYLISNDTEVVLDSSWLNIGDSNGNFSLGKREYLISKFEIDNKKYEIGIIEPRNPLSFTYGFRSQISILSDSGIKKDSISESDLIAFGEALNLNGKYYRFEKISNNGDIITLVKDKSFESKIGTQKGMIAPSFKVITMSGDTLTNSYLQNKLTVIANSCGCGGDKESTEAFYEMERTFGNQINILHVDSDIKILDIGIHIESQEEFNKDFYNNYRKEYCSRLCYVIGKDNRILEKFNINEWKNILPKTIKN
ncbi:hypothetical protein VDP25_03285 [Winogradskyella sp. ECml5-4]|uniref:hypothetical protein n=1 Tax=Winogradskyella sp. ECml5-4 TaxID=3110975 RepID=UPI002FEF42A4